MTLEILRRRLVTFDRGYAGVMYAVVTEVRLGVARGIVRENRRASSIEHFVMSSTTRLGHKADGDRVGHEVLELAAPRRVWQLLATAVAATDDLDRAVVRNARWTMNTAQRALRRGISYARDSTAANRVG